MKIEAVRSSIGLPRHRAVRSSALLTLSRPSRGFAGRQLGSIDRNNLGVDSLAEAEAFGAQARWEDARADATRRPKFLDERRQVEGNINQDRLFQCIRRTNGRTHFLNAFGLTLAPTASYSRRWLAQPGHFSRILPENCGLSSGNSLNSHHWRHSQWLGRKRS